MKVLNGKDFKEMVNSGAANLENYQAEINALNVFPVPDGDTGTNMSMTFSNGAKEANSCFSNNIGDVAKALSKGLLMGARGNSGVFLEALLKALKVKRKLIQQILQKHLKTVLELLIRLL